MLARPSVANVLFGGNQVRCFSYPQDKDDIFPQNTSLGLHFSINKMTGTNAEHTMIERVFSQRLVSMGLFPSTNHSRESLSVVTTSHFGNESHLFQSLFSVLEKPITKSEISDALRAAEATPLFPPQDYLQEVILQTGFTGQIAKPLLKKQQNVTEKTVNDAVKELAINGNIVVNGIGFQTNELISKLKKQVETNPNIKKWFSEKRKTDILSSTYKGGYKFLPLNTIPIGGPKCETNAHLGLFLPTNGNTETMSVLRNLFGGGYTFEKGGPGKGLFSRLCQTTLTSPDVEFAQTYYIPFSRDGVFGFCVSCDPKLIPTLFLHLLDHLLTLCKLPPNSDELTTAKNSHRLTYVHSLEEPSALALESGKQLLLRDSIINVRSTNEAIDRITPNEISTIATDLFSKVPTVVVFADKAQINTYPKEHEFLSIFEKAKQLLNEKKL